MENQATSLKNLLTDTDRHKLKTLAVSLKKKEVDLASYKDTLANILRRMYDLTAIVQKAIRRTEQEQGDCNTIIAEIKDVLGEMLV
ncbi:MAG: hypothetical protein FJW63_01875 [Actinobacteria bacterium]|nr:hypothetical protein [Actinomycetota bacterium]